jgi:hypothetical protein
MTTCLYVIITEAPIPTLPSPLTTMSTSTSLTPSPIPTPSPALTSSPAPIQYQEPPDEFVQDRITYVKCAKIAREDRRLGSSHVWKYGLQYVRGNDKKELYYCHEYAVGNCKQELFVVNGTSRARSHLEEKHHIDPQSGVKKKSRTRKFTLDQQKGAATTSNFLFAGSCTVILPSTRKLALPWTSLLFKSVSTEPTPKGCENYSRLGYGRLSIEEAVKGDASGLLRLVTDYKGRYKS